MNKSEFCEFRPGVSTERIGAVIFPISVASDVSNTDDTMANGVTQRAVIRKILYLVKKPALLQ